MKHLGDITFINGGVIEPVDCITFGSPCQDLSVAGKQDGLEGERSGLFYEAARIITEMRCKTNGRYPTFAVWENVPGAFSSSKGEDFRTVLEMLAKICDPAAVIPGPPGGKWRPAGCVMGNGWSIAWRVLDAQFWGVPQRRARIALVVDFGGGRAPEILFERKGLPGYTPQGGAAGKRTAAGAERSAYPAVARTLIARYDGSPCIDRGQNIICEPIHKRKSGTAYGFQGKAGAKSGSIAYGRETAPTLDTSKVPCVLPFDTTQITSPQNGSNPQYGSPCHPLAAAAHPPCICIAGNVERGSNCNGVGILEEAAYTLNTTERHCVFENHGQDSRITGPLDVCLTVSKKFGTGGNNVPLVMAAGCIDTYQKVTGALMANSHPGSYTGQDAYNDMLIAHTLKAKANMDFREDSDTLVISEIESWNVKRVRRLTPLECDRLQGYPDNWTDIGPWVDTKGKLHKASSDSSRYQADGNSIAVPVFAYVCDKMAACLPQGAKLGSLFDGIGGFPLIWERIHGKGTARWASEIEEFPIAVTKFHFGEL